MWKFLSWMNAGEDTKKISVQCRRIRDARVPEQGGKHGRERNPKHHDGGEACRARAIQFFDERAHDERRVLRLLPRQDAQDACLHGQIENSDAGDRYEYTAGNVFLRVAYFTAKVANIVVTPVR